MDLVNSFGDCSGLRQIKMCLNLKQCDLEKMLIKGICLSTLRGHKDLSAH